MIDVMEEKDIYLAEFTRFEKQLGAKERSSWLHELRTAAIERFAELGFPGPRDEDWKFTNLAPLLHTPFRLAGGPPPRLVPGQLARALDPGASCRLVFVDGRFAPEWSQGEPQDGIVIGSLAALLEREPAIQRHLAKYAAIDRHVFVALNSAFLRDGAFVYLPRGAVVSQPIHLVFVAQAGTEPAVQHPRTLIVAGDNAQAAIVQSYVGPEGAVTFTNAVTEVACGPGAHLDHYKIQREQPQACHIEMVHVQQQRASTFRSHAITFGGGLVRNEIHAVLADEGCECTLNGLYQATGRQHIDNHTVIDHARPHCASHELYKGILDGQAHGVFNGKIFVRPDAQKTDAKQTNQTLLLSEDAVINTKPQLEIFADDVKCTHGATVGQLSADAIYYLRTRGIGLAEARSILTFAFANDIVGRIAIEPLRQQLEELLLAGRLPPSGRGGKELT